MTTATKDSPPRGGKHDRVQLAFAQLLSEACRRGVYGAATLSFNVQDGAIQQIRVSLERTVQ